MKGLRGWGRRRGYVRSAVQPASSDPSRGLMNIDTSNGHPAMNYPEHIRTYKGFVRATVILTGLTALLLLGMLVTLV